MSNSIINYFITVLDILVVAWIFYKLILLIRGTRAVQILLGIIILALFTIFVGQIVHLRMLSWILEKFWTISPIILAIVFQPELRQALAQLGGEPLKRMYINSELKAIKEIVTATCEMSEKKTGALIAIEQQIGLKNYMETGTLINGEISKELLSSIFYPKSILHDGAVIIEGSKIMSAGCVFPVSDNMVLSKIIGIRHRAAIGISEISDAIVIVVSEETGHISIACEGRLQQNIEPGELQKQLSDIYLKKLKKSFVRKNAQVKTN
ncbi:MAG: TIGR00159 family protein [Elusimicrobia bacterium RIFOXYA2_FULL_39_19]|nr:MAG: TIGR00159 family protein [Elusimicrobia bacterium RIFOXYA2_FULL_39_19]